MIMRVSCLSRFASSALALLVGLSAPGLALAHGYAHHEAHEHAEPGHGHGSEHVAGAPVAALVDRDAWFKAPAPRGDHAHPEVTQAPSIRTDLAGFVLPLPAHDWSSAYAVVDTASLLLTAAPPRAGPPGAPPRQPRAPPVV